MSIEKIKLEILNLRGANVKIFGQPTELPSDVSDNVIDIIDVLDELKHYEKELRYEVYNEETDDYEEKYFDSVEEYVDFMEDEMGYWREITHDNSYNWSSPVSNDFDFKTFSNDGEGTFIVQLMVHKYGDVRGNYTEYALLEFDYEEGFLYAIMECNKQVDIGDNHYAMIDIFSDGFEIYTNDGEYVKTVYDLDDDIDLEELA